MLMQASTYILEGVNGIRRQGDGVPRAAGRIDVARGHTSLKKSMLVSRCSLEHYAWK